MTIRYDRLLLAARALRESYEAGNERDGFNILRTYFDRDDLYLPTEGETEQEHFGMHAGKLHGRKLRDDFQSLFGPYACEQATTAVQAAEYITWYVVDRMTMDALDAVERAQEDIAS
jgi:hypothetical protein